MHVHMEFGGNPWELVLSFYHVGPGDQIQFTGLGSKCHSLSAKPAHWSTVLTS